MSHNFPNPPQNQRHHLVRCHAGGGNDNICIFFVERTPFFIKHVNCLAGHPQHPAFSQIAQSGFQPTIEPLSARVDSIWANDGNPFIFYNVFLAVALIASISFFDGLESTIMSFS